jgi:nucleoside-diphosphate-sugar epimerase
VRRFIFISSIGVNGHINTQPFTEDDLPNPDPTDFYAQSKLQAEQGLWEIQKETGMEIVVIRPPLVYGPGAPGNFGVLVRWVEKGLPLPLGAIHNKRSLVALDNLVDLIATCIDHPNAANQVFLVSDGEDLSTTQLLQGVADAMGKPSRLIPVPASVLQFAATLLGKKAVAQRLLGSLQVDIRHTQKCLNWTPPLTVKQGLARCFPNQQD